MSLPKGAEAFQQLESLQNWEQCIGILSIYADEGPVFLYSTTGPIAVGPFDQRCISGTGRLVGKEYRGGNGGVRQCFESRQTCLAKDQGFLNWHRANEANFRTVAQSMGLIGVGARRFLPPLPGSLSVGDFLFVIGTLAGNISLNHQKIADDPPDLNYQVIYQYPARNLSRNWGLSAASNDHLNLTLNVLARVDDALAGRLASIERTQGAYEALDLAAADAQLAAAETFAEDYQRYANEAEQLLAGLPVVLQTDIPFDSSELEAAIDELGQDGIPAELADVLIEISGDPTAPDQALAFAQSLSGLTTAESAFSSLLLTAQQLATSDCDNGQDDDGDGLFDLGDPDCSYGTGQSESPPPTSVPLLSPGALALLASSLLFLGARACRPRIAAVDRVVL